MFEEISEKLSKITKDVSVGTQQQLEIMKLKSNIKQEEAVVENAYKEIGKLYFSQNTEETPEEYLKYVEAVKTANARVSQCKEKIVHMKGIQFCVECDQKIKNDMHFCPNCGVKIAKLQASKDTDNKEKKEDLVEAENICE